MLCVGCYVASGSVRCGARGSCVCVICCWPSTTVHNISLTEKYRTQHANATGSAPVPSPLASSKRRAQHAKATGRAPAPSRRSAGVHPTPWHQIAPHTKVALQSRQFSASSSTDAVPATKSAHGGSHSAVAATKSTHGGSQSAAPATKSAPGGSQSAAPATKSAPRGSHGAAPATKSAHRGSHSAAPAPKSAHGGSQSAVLATRSVRLPRNLHIKRRCPADARAYIRPLGKQQAPHTARKCYRQSAGAQLTPGRTSDPWASSKRRTQCTWRFTKCCACHEICT